MFGSYLNVFMKFSLSPVAGRVGYFCLLHINKDSGHVQAERASRFCFMMESFVLRVAFPHPLCVDARSIAAWLVSVGRKVSIFIGLSAG